MTRPRIAILIGTSRQGRFADQPARWLMEMAGQRDDADYDLLDLRDFPLPFFDEPASPMFVPPADPVAQRWAQTLERYDGFVIIAAEYNHSMSGVLKNALDYAYREFNRKAVAFAGYGGVGAARAIEQLRLVCVELQMAPVKAAVHMNMPEFLGIWREGKSFDDYPHLAQAAGAMFDDLNWWTRALKAARS